MTNDESSLPASETIPGTETQSASETAPGDAGRPNAKKAKGPRRRARIPLLIGAILLGLVAAGGVTYTVVDVVRDLTRTPALADTLRPGDGRFDPRTGGRGFDGNAPSGAPQRPDANGSATTRG